MSEPVKEDIVLFSVCRDVGESYALSFGGVINLG